MSEKKEVIFMSFGLNSEPKQMVLKKEKIIQNFSKGKCDIKSQLEEYIGFSSMTQRDALGKKVQEVVDFVNNSSKEEVVKARKQIFSYLSNFMFSQITSLLNDNKKGAVNFTICLGLNRYLKDLTPVSKIQEFSRKIASSKKDFNCNARLFNKYFSSLINSVFSGIDKKFFNDDKKGIITNNKMVKSFSNKTKNISKLEASISLAKNKEEVKQALKLFAKNFSLEDCEAISGKDCYPILGDEKINEEVLIVVDDKKSIQRIIDYIANSCELICNFSTSSRIPLVTSPDQTLKGVTHVPSITGGSWLMIYKNKVGNKTNLTVRKFPKEVPYKLLALPESEVKMYLADKQYFYFTGSFDTEYEADEKARDICDNAMMTGGVTNFSKDLKFSEVKGTKTKPKMCVEKVDGGHIALIAHNQEGNFTLEVRTIADKKNGKEKKITFETARKNPLYATVWVDNEKQLMKKSKEFALEDYSSVFKKTKAKK